MNLRGVAHDGFSSPPGMKISSSDSIFEGDRMNRQPSVFISYTHKDKERIVPLASYLGRLGLKVWMDTKDLVAGQRIIEKVSEAISKSDLYVVCLSPAALSSPWVNHELSAALTLETTQGRPKVLPIMIAKSEIPAMLTGRLYVDMTGSLDQAKQKLKQTIETHLDQEAMEQIKKVPMERQLVISSVRLILQEETAKCCGGLTHDFDNEEVQEEAVEHLKFLRRKANGVLLNYQHQKWILVLHTQSSQMGIYPKELRIYQVHLRVLFPNEQSSKWKY
jgi:hypothetical protein